MRDYNTILVDDRPSDLLEKELWKPLDDYLTELLDEIESIIGEGSLPKFDGRNKDDFCVFTSMMMKRPQEGANIPEPEVVGQQVYTATLEAIRSRDEDASSYSRDAIKLKQIGRDVIARAKASRPDQIIEELRNYHIVWAVPERTKSFVLGSKMIYRMPNGGNGHLDHHLTQMLFPLMPRLAAVFVRKDMQADLINVISRDRMRQWNEAIASSSNMVGSHSRSLIKSLIGN